MLSVIRIIYSVVLISGLLAAGIGEASQTPGQTTANDRMFEFSATNPPVGYEQFCRTFPDDCGPFEPGPARIRLSTEAWRQLVDVNDFVNAAVQPATDMELYGVEEWWTYPLDFRGDCEDYVLLKRKMLIERGWPAASLLITVVRDEEGDGHAVLTVVTSAGDVVLDNQHPEIRLWNDTPYSYLMRQSKSAPDRWVSLRDDRLQPQLPVAGLEGR
jgi:predicted transglutaminase-like cysteine proteinase